MNGIIQQDECLHAEVHGTHQFMFTCAEIGIIYFYFSQNPVPD